MNSQPPLHHVAPQHETALPLAARGAEHDAFSDFLRILWRNKFILIASVLACLGLGIFALSRTTPIYTANTQILIDSQEQRILDADAVLMDGALTSATMPTAVAIIGSRNILSGVVEDLRLGQYPEFAGNPETGATYSPAQLVTALRNRLGVWQEGPSYVINLDFKSQDPVLAATVVNAVADSYIASRLDERLDATRRASAWLDTRVTELREEVDRAESAVVDKRSSNLSLDQSSVEMANQQLAQLGAAMSAAQADRLAVEARYANLQKLVTERGAAGAAQQVPNPVTADLQSHLLALRQQVNLLRATLTPDSAQIRNLEVAIRSAERSLSDEFQNYLAAARNEVAVARDRETSLGDSVRALEERIVANSRAAIELSQFEREAEAIRTLYETFLVRLNETRAQEVVERTKARVISRADVPDWPSSPRKALILAASLLLGGMLGIGLVALRELLNRVYRTPDDVVEGLDLPVLASVPRRRGQAASVSRILADPASGFSEQIRQLRTSLLFSYGGKPPRTVMVTSSAQGEGKTTVVLALAQMSGLVGRKAIVIEADLRAPSIAEAFNWKVEHDIVSTLLGTSELDEAIRRDPTDNFDVLPCGARQMANTADALSSDQFRALIDKLKSRYDLVLIDTPPVLAVADAGAIGRLADASLYVLRANHTRRPAARRGLAGLAEVGVKISGIVLTMTDQKEKNLYPKT